MRMAFYCNGLKDVCTCDILCADCKYYDDTGGKQVQTNADRIRAMSDREMATDLLDMLEEICEDGRPGEEWMLHWLKQPAEVDNG